VDNLDVGMAHDIAEADRSEVAKRPLAIDSPLGPGALLTTRLDGEDALSRCFLYRVEVIGLVPEASVEALVGEPVTLWLMDDGTESRRPIHGHVRSVASLGHDVHGHRQFELEVVPRLWFLSCTCDCRIFQDLSVPEILRMVFIEHGLTDFTFRVVQEEYPKLDYCVQYEESALDFVSRLMEHLGIFYWHEHHADKHTLMLGDRNAATGRCTPESVSLASNRVGGEIQSLDFRTTFRPGKWTLNDYDFESPTKRLLVGTPTTLNVPRMRNHEIYRWAGEFTQHDDGTRLSRIRMEMEEARHRVVSGAGHCIGFDPGQRVGIDAGRGSLGGVYLLTEVRHHATGPGIESGPGAEGYRYNNEFVAIPAATPYRPPLITSKPVMRGSQTATVVGPPGESIYCDPFGRVRVQFHWDRRGLRNDRSSCWIRVSQTRAGSFYGSLVIPHVGHEVIVAFLEGDPDRPLIVGSVPNALTMPPVELPLDKHKTISRDHADNRTIMQGKPGQEHFTMVSPRRVATVAAPHGARPLSAYGLPTTFSDKVDQFDGFQIEPYKDADGLYEVWETWFMLCHPSKEGVPPIQDENGSGTHDIQNDLTQDAGPILKVTAPSSGSSSSSPSSSYTWSDSPSLDVKADACDISSFTTGRNNAVSLGNKNTWVYANNNTWVNGDSNSHIKGNSYSNIDCSSVSTVADIAFSFVGNDRTNITGVTQQSIVGGLNMSVASVAVSLSLLSFSKSLLDNHQYQAQINDIVARIKTIEADVHSSGIKLEDHGFHLHEPGDYVIQSGNVMYA